MNGEEKQAALELCEGNIIKLKGTIATFEAISPELDILLKLRSELIIQQAGLAALTAQPIGRVDRGAATDSNEYPDARVVCLHDQADWENFPDGTELFLCPTPAVGMNSLKPYAWLVHAPQGDYVERNPDVVAHLEGAGLTKCKPLYLAL